jgi:MYXO-CTERM domain-containing protein
MKLARAIVLSIPLAALALTHVRDASACGGCFVQQSENTQVTSHRMILSVSTQETTLWDQIVYSGEPQSFAWVLPIKGTVGIDLSSDALFQNLDLLTQVSVNSPQITCPPPPDCGFDNGGGFSTGGVGTGGAGGGGVTVIAEEVVGPYETVQLMSSDPAALTNWLLMHGYNIPPDIVPVINAYVNESFNFLALKLVPGQGIDSMRPVRVTTPGAAPVLPLRMVAAGTGTTTPITLWIVGEGRYEPKNFASFLIQEKDLVWNWDTSSSNYRDLRDAGFAGSMGKSWLVEAGEPFSKWSLSDPLNYLAQYDPLESGYADDMGMGAVASCEADLDALFGLIPDSSLWVTRIYGELSRAALGTDLDLQAEASQSQVQRYFEAPNTIGTPPACPTFPPCDNTTSSGNTSGGSGTGGLDDVWDWNGNGNNDKLSGGGGCAMEGKAASPVTFAAAAALVGLGLLRRRNRRATVTR